MSKQQKELVKMDTADSYTQDLIYASAALASDQLQAAASIVEHNENEQAAAVAANLHLDKCDNNQLAEAAAAKQQFDNGTSVGLASSSPFIISVLAQQILQPSATLINSTKNYYQWLESFADPRVESWPLMASPGPVLAIFFLYLFAANYGPSLMKSRKPLQLRWLLVIYNLYVASLNLWIALELCYCSYKLRYTSMCQLVVATNTDPYVLRIANGVWWYFASKGIEFADTLFFILRKKDRQLTFLHKYHHSSMFLVWWTAVRFVPGGSAIIPIVVNSLVHVLMYAYYGLTALGPRVQKYLWWKRHLTMVQLVQFFIGVAIGIRLITSNCQFTRWMQYVFSGYAFSFIILFGNFYLHEYIKGRQMKNIKQQQQQQQQLQQQQQQNDLNKVKQS